MNLINGNLMARQQADEIDLQALIESTLKKPPLESAKAIEALCRLSDAVGEQHTGILTSLGMDKAEAEQQIAELKQFLSRDYLTEKIRIELGEANPDISYVPLGVLLHIAPDNAPGAAFLTVAEGLLTGNINLLKLPGGNNTVTLALLLKLTELAPELAEYIYVLDYSSGEKDRLQALMDISDAVAVWGGDETIKSVRSMAAPNTEIIEWGHKISLAYITDTGSKEELEALAGHICRTDQLLCSACQGIFLDTDDMQNVYEFCEEFIKILSEQSEKTPHGQDTAKTAQITLIRQNNRIVSELAGKKVYQGTDCSITASEDSELETSALFRNIWVKRLERNEIIKLKKHKNHLQTAGLICGGHEREELSALLLRAGVTRVTTAANMSKNFMFEPHDGKYPLERYIKRVFKEKTGGF